MKNQRPPAWAVKLLERMIDPVLFDGIYGDLMEHFHHLQTSKGARIATWHFIWSVIGFVRYRHLLKKQTTYISSLISPQMLRNHFTIARRNLIKNRGYTLINITGLTISFACCILIALYVQDELSFDKYHPKHPQIYRIANHAQGASYENGIAKVFEPWAPEAKASIPEVKDACRFVFYRQTLFTKGDDKIYERYGLYTDSTVFNLFNWRMLQGDPSTALTAPNSIVLTKRLADKYFPNGNALGETLLLDNQDEMKVTGIIQNIPANSHFTFSFLVSLSSYTPPDQGSPWSRWNQYYSFVLLQEGAKPEQVAKKIDLMLDQHLDEETAKAWTPFLQPLASIHLDSKLHREMSANGDKSYIYIFSLIGLLILLIATTNFVNLFTARSTHRAKEVGVRKVLGANRGSLIQQFIIESFIVCLFAATFASILSNSLLPFLNTFLRKQMELDLLGNLWLGGGLFFLVLITAIVSGAYPAIMLSSYQAVNALKSELTTASVKKVVGKKHHGLLRKSLVVVQFSIATFLIIGSLVVTQQFSFIQQKNLGFNKDQIINIPMSTPSTIRRADIIKAELAKVPGVLHVSASANRPGGSDYGVPYQVVGPYDGRQPAMRCLIVDEDFLDTYGMQLAQGRGFSKDMATDSNAYLINETAAKQLGWENPLEHQLSMPAVDREPAPIIGVVKDFNFRSLHEPIGPLYFFLEKTWFSQFNVKLDAERVDETLALLQRKWPEFEPDHPFRYTFFDQTFGALHAAERRTARIINWSTLIAIFITCLGLLGLATYTSERRTKEIGIRKVLGASVLNILLMLCMEVMVLVGIAVLLAAPFAWFASSNWLENYAYSIDLGPRFFLIAAILAFGVALLTVGYHAIKSALRNPIKSLRFE